MTLPEINPPAIIQAHSKDTGAITAFLEKTNLVHRHLDWRSLMQWIEAEPFLLKIEDKTIRGILSCAPDPEGVAWIHCFAASDMKTCRQTWLDLFDTAREHQALKGCTMCSVVLQDWFMDLLDTSGFSVIQDIVVLYWNGKMPDPMALAPDILIRPMELSDLDQVVQVDHEAFAPIWTISIDSFKEVYTLADHANVAEIDGRVIGYEVSTANHFSAHLTRLAVHPEFKQANIGFSLVREMLTSFSRHGIRHISVNTQTDNVASISLYKKLGFTLSEETFPVMCYTI